MRQNKFKNTDNSLIEFALIKAPNILYKNMKILDIVIPLNFSL